LGARQPHGRPGGIASVAVRKEIGYVLLNVVSALKSPMPILEKLVATPGVMSSFAECSNLADVDMIAMGIRWAGIVLRYRPKRQVRV
jgi:hypothetical protein